MNPPAPPRLDYRSPDLRNDGTRRRAHGGAAAAAAAALLAGGVLVSLPWVFGRHVGCEIPSRVSCSSNLNQIELGILLFQQDHGGHYPASLADVLSAVEIGPRPFVCPATADAPAAVATPATTRQAAAALAVPGHLSYRYCGRADWSDATVPADAVVAYEPLTNHDGDGSNILFGDGHVDWVPRARALRLTVAAAATPRPVSAASVP